MNDIEPDFTDGEILVGIAFALVMVCSSLIAVIVTIQIWRAIL